nr:glycosyltransferase [Prolixibacteraceae bacterium]
MNILIINKSYQTGGAAIAAQRLWKALTKQGVDARFLVFDNDGTEHGDYIALTKTLFHTFRWWFNFMLERVYFAFFMKNMRSFFAISPAIAGIDITKTKVFKAADIVHINWINNGFLSLRSLQKIFRSGKPVVWTLHDSWAFTGGCHLPMDCTHYE